MCHVSMLNRPRCPLQLTVYNPGPAESEIKKVEDASQKSSAQPRRTQEDKEKARQIDGIIHNVLQSVSHLSVMPNLFL